MPSFEQDHFFLLELATITKPQSSYHLDYTYSSIDQVADLNSGDEFFDETIYTGHFLDLY